MLDLLLSMPWLIAILWLALWLFDAISTLWFADAYQNSLGRYYSLEGGVELNPRFEKDVAQRRLLRPRNVALLVLTCAIILASSWLGRFAVEFVAGTLLLIGVFVDLQHIARYLNITWLRLRPDSLKGRQESTYWLRQRMLASEALTFSLLCALVALLTTRLFFVAGALGSLSGALRHYSLSSRKPPEAQPRQEASRES